MILTWSMVKNTQRPFHLHMFQWHLELVLGGPWQVQSFDILVPFPFDVFHRQFKDQVCRRRANRHGCYETKEIALALVCLIYWTIHASLLASNNLDYYIYLSVFMILDGFLSIYLSIYLSISFHDLGWISIRSLAGLSSFQYWISSENTLSCELSGDAKWIRSEISLSWTRFLIHPSQPRY